MRNQYSLGVKNTLTLKALKHIVEAYNIYGLHAQTKYVIYEAALKLEKQLQEGGLPIRLKENHKKLIIDEDASYADINDEALNHWRVLEEWAKSKIGTEYKARGRKEPMIFESYSLNMSATGAYFTFQGEMHGILINYAEDMRRHERKQQSSKS